MALLLWICSTALRYFSEEFSHAHVEFLVSLQNFKLVSRCSKVIPSSSEFAPWHSEFALQNFNTGPWSFVVSFNIFPIIHHLKSRTLESAECSETLTKIIVSTRNFTLILFPMVEKDYTLICQVFMSFRLMQQSYPSPHKLSTS